MAKIITLTLNPCIDKFFTVDRLIAEQKLSVRNIEEYPGGGGLNVSRALSHLGGTSTALWSCGGPIGHHLEELLAGEDFEQRTVATTGETRENVIIYEESSDQYYRFSLPGPVLSNAELIAWKNEVRATTSSDAYFVFSGSLPPGASSEWFGDLIRSVAAGQKVIVDTKGDALRAALDAGVYLVKPNIRELTELTGRRLEGDEEVESASRQIIDNAGAEVVLVSMGRAGALLVTADTTDHIRSPIVPIRSKVGAGDSMVGGIVLALTRGLTVTDAARFGVAAGAAAVMTEGTELCKRYDTERLFDWIKTNL